MQPYQAAELLRRVVSGVHLSQELTQEARRRCLLPAQARDIEIERDIAYAGRGQLVTQQRHAADAVLLRGILLRLRAYVAELKPGQSRKGLRAVRARLPCLKRCLLRGDERALLAAPGGGYGLKLFRVALAPLLARRVGGDHDDLAAMGVLQQHRADELLKIALSHSGAQPVEEIADLHQRLGRAAVQPAVEHAEADAKALRIVAIVPLAHLKLQIRHRSLQLATVKAVFGQVRKNSAQLLPGGSELVLAEVAYLKLYEWLGAAVPEHHADRFAQSCGKQLPREHGLVAATQDGA